MGKGPGKGSKGSGPKGGKGPFQGNCNYCGVYGHRTNECRKKDADLKGKGKGQDPMSDPGWNSPTPSPFHGKGQKFSWKRREGSMGNGEGSLLDGG